jgi:hypothetical protein
VPFPLALACAAGAVGRGGRGGGLPALRVKGMYLGISTMAFGFIVAEVFARWESLTGGNAGLHVKPPAIGGWQLDSGNEFYYLCLVLAMLSTLAILNLLRSPTGPCLRRHPRLRDLGAEHGHPPGALQDDVVRHLGRAGRAGRRAVRAHDQVPVAPTSSTSSSRSTCC